ncbi:MAG TPA: hypothetical protein VD927_18855 [Chryseosolibacter sp.]|nr:hypothetical protein [Chryseosolibacter sp.]
MRLSIIKELREKAFISQDQYNFLESVFSGKIISLYYELRIVLYLGVMLFATGCGILIYKNIGELGHLLTIIALIAITAGCFLYAFKKGNPYDDGKVTHATAYFDYIVLLGSLLFVSVLTYLQFQYSLFDETMGITTLMTAAFFFLIAYRFDHLGVLSLGITAFASFWSLSISPQKWYHGDFVDQANLEFTAVLFGSTLALLTFIIDRKNIKKHFTFTYLNFAALIYLTGALSGVFADDDVYGYYLIALFLGCGFSFWYARTTRTFLFLLYAFIFGYIGFSFMLADLIIDDVGFWFFYLLASCGAFIYFIIRSKSYFKRAE